MNKISIIGLSIAALLASDAQAQKRPGCGYLLRCTEIDPLQEQLEQLYRQRREAEEKLKRQQQELAEEERRRQQERNEAAASTARYHELAMRSETYIGRVFALTGKVVQTVHEGNVTVLRINITRGPHDIWTDTVWVDYRPAPGEPTTIGEGQIVSFNGRFLGLKSYNAVLGQRITIPHFFACQMQPQTGSMRIISVPKSC